MAQRVWVNCLLVCLAGVLARADCPPGAVEWTGQGDGTTWSDGLNWTSAPFPPPAGADVCHLIGGTIELDIGTPGTPVQIASFSVDGANSGGLEVQPGRGLQIDGDFENTNLDPDHEYHLTINQGGRLVVAERLKCVRGDLLASGPLGTTRLEVGLQIYTEAAWNVQDGAQVDAWSVRTGNTWHLAPGAQVQLIAIGLGPPFDPWLEPDTLCWSQWFLDQARLQVTFAEGPICWQVIGGHPDMEILALNKLVARRLALSDGMPSRWATVI